MSSRVVYQSEKTKLKKSNHRLKLIALVLFLLSAAQLMATVYFNRDNPESESQRQIQDQQEPVSYTHLTLPTIIDWCRSRWSPYH